MSNISTRKKSLVKCEATIKCGIVLKNQTMVILVAALIVLIHGISIKQVIADSTIFKSNDKLNYLGYPNITSSTSSKLVTSTTNYPLNKNNSINSEINQTNYPSYDLVIEDDSSRLFNNINNQLYQNNFSINSDNSLSSFLFDTDRNKNSTPGSAATAAAADDDLIVSGSRYIPKSASSRFDEDIDSSMIEDDISPDYLYPSNYEGASSSVNEQRVVKELTKMLSKGISSATDQVGLDTLENWKRRQKKRKVVKDNRAKLFEDLINAAISSHPDKPKKRNRKRSNMKDENLKTSTSSLSSTGLLNNPNIDPELAGEAENVVHHLQGLAKLIEGHQPTQSSFGLGGSYSDETSLNDEIVSSQNDESYVDGGQSESSDIGEEKGYKKTSASSANERPIVRQLKKIKQQISQRRKQLDQIKKIFNVELAINPKDGSLMGKSTSNQKRPRDNIVESNDYSDDIGSYQQQQQQQVFSRKKSTKNNKMRDLMLYLKENPEILASVMAELTVDADPTRTSSSSHQSSDDSSIHSISNSQERDISSSFNRSPDIHELDRFESVFKAKKSAKRLLELNEASSNRRKTSRSTIDSLDGVVPLIKPQSLKSKTAEDLLLASLRERQLLNLARLDSVMADRQQASNRSNNIISSTNYTHDLNSTRKDDLNSSQARINNSDSAMAQPINQSNGVDSQQNQNRIHNVSSAITDDMDSQNYINNQQVDSQMIRHQQNERQFVDQYQPISKYHDQVSDNIQSSYNNYNNPHQSNIAPSSRSQSQPYSQQQQPLNRFRDWRDVSQAETNLSHRSDKSGQGNITWPSYDLTTGGSSNALEADRVPAQSINNNHRMHHQYNRNNLNFNNEAKINSGGGSTYNQIKIYPDSAMTRPGAQAGSFISMEQPYQRLAYNGLGNSMFMTRSSASDQGHSTGQTPSLKDDVANDQQDQELIDDGVSGMDNFSDPQHGQPPVAVDYFSAYKQEKDEPSISRHKKKQDQPKTDMGAMWAK